MVRRIVTVAVVFGALIAAVVLTGASEQEVGKTYKAEFDNAFGLAEGGDLRIGGVNAGQTTKFSLSEPESSDEPFRAVVEFEISEPGFDSLREDTECEIRQQSLIGEYYVDCQPGTSDQELPEGATIPIEQTSSTIPADLVNNVLREPYRERLRLIIAELGTGLAGRPDDLAETLRRAHPGLRETNEVLGILAGQTQVLRDFVSDSDEVIDDLAANRDDVVRFVEEAGETAEIAATRREELAQQFERLPTFLAELDPTMVRLGQLADAQIPLLADLRAASDELRTFFVELGPFSQASRPAIRTLGDTSVVGRRAINESANEVRELKRVARGAGGVGEPLRQFLQTMDDRDRAIEDDRRSALTDPPGFDRESLQNRTNRGLGTRGFTGFEALLNYSFWQSLSINSFDGISHFLRAGLLVNEHCSPMGVGEPDRATIAECNSYVGPNQPGVANASGNLGNNRNVGSPDPDPTERGGAAPTVPAPSSAGERRAQSTSLERDGQAAGDEEDAVAESSGVKGQEPEQQVDPESRGPSGGLPDDLENTVERARRGVRQQGGSNGRDPEREDPGGRDEAGEVESQAGDASRDATEEGAATQSSGGASSEELLNFLLGP